LTWWPDGTNGRLNGASDFQMIDASTSDALAGYRLQSIMHGQDSQRPRIRVWDADSVRDRLPAWEAWFESRGPAALSYHPRWLWVLGDGLRHVPYCLEASCDEQITGLLPLELVASRLFGRFLVGLPYLNVGGVMAEHPDIAAALLDRAVQLADELDVKHLELRHETIVTHPALSQTPSGKVHMRLALPHDVDTLWAAFKPGVRNQIRKGEKQEFTVLWGAEERLDDFYAVFSQNMRDLGTPVFSRRLFGSILPHFGDSAELCVVRAGRRPVAAALVCHGRGTTEVPSASSLRAVNSTNANMYLYWQLLQRAVGRGQHTFDFGRSTVDSGTYRFKKQWGAAPYPAAWQYYVRRGDRGDLRPENRKYQVAIRVWQWLPVWLANLIGPPIVRGIP
jgi:serine/alanine adding enzyme